MPWTMTCMGSSIRIRSGHSDRTAAPEAQGPGDVVALYLVAAGEDAGRQGVAQQGLGLSLDHAERAAQLHRVQAERDGRLADREFRQRGRDRVVAAPRQPG